LVYASFVCLASMTMFWWLEQQPGWEWLGDFIAIAWIALSIGALAWMKVWMVSTRRFVLWAPTYEFVNRRILRLILVCQEHYRIYPSRPEPGPACSMTIIIIFVVYVYLLLGFDAVL